MRNQEGAGKIADPGNENALPLPKTCRYRPTRESESFRWSLRMFLARSESSLAVQESSCLIAPAANWVLELVAEDDRGCGPESFEVRSFGFA